VGDVNEAPEAVMRMLVVYMRPRDMPSHVVVRGWRVLRGQLEPVAEKGAIAFEIAEGQRSEAEALKMARRHCRQLQLFPMARREDDDPKIVEIWL
jgi:hypothetical protein